MKYIIAVKTVRTKFKFECMQAKSTLIRHDKIMRVCARALQKSNASKIQEFEQFQVITEN